MPAIAYEVDITIGDFQCEKSDVSNFVLLSMQDSEGGRTNTG